MPLRSNPPSEKKDEEEDQDDTDKTDAPVAVATAANETSKQRLMRRMSSSDMILSTLRDLMEHPFEPVLEAADSVLDPAFYLVGPAARLRKRDFPRTLTPPFGI